jgi:hypothetical protein
LLERLQVVHGAQATEEGEERFGGLHPAAVADGDGQAGAEEGRGGAEEIAPLDRLIGHEVV